MAKIKTTANSPLRQLHTTVKVYRYLSIVFSVAGLLILILFYALHMEGQDLQGMLSPSLIGVLVVAFLPAIVFSMKASKTEKELEKKVESAKRSQGIDIPSE